jgi:hypothetical protein
VHNSTLFPCPHIYIRRNKGGRFSRYACTSKDARLLYPMPKDKKIFCMDNFQTLTIAILIVLNLFCLKFTWTGQKIESLKMINAEVSMDITKLPSGIYLIKAITDNGIIINKFIKE